MQRDRPGDRRVELRHLGPLLVGDQRLHGGEDDRLVGGGPRREAREQPVDEAPDQAPSGRLLAVLRPGGVE